jgi:hypothetical protein
MKILILLHGNYGNRIAENLAARSPQDWHINLMELPKALPVIVDEPANFLPAQIPAIHLLPHELIFVESAPPRPQRHA